MPYIIKYLTENKKADLQTLGETDSDVYMDYFKMLNQHLPRVTEFIDTFQLKGVENTEYLNSSEEIDMTLETFGFRTSEISSIKEMYFVDPWLQSDQVHRP